MLADERKLRQAVANVVQNAVKFSPHGGEVLVEVSRDPGRVRFPVYDQGPGVLAGEAERIFEPLFHAAARRCSPTSASCGRPSRTSSRTR